MSWGPLQVRMLLCCVATRAFNFETTEAPAAEPLVLGNFGERGRQLSEACCGTVAVTLTGAALSSRSSSAGAYTVVAGQTQDGRAVYQQRDLLLAWLLA